MYDGEKEGIVSVQIRTGGGGAHCSLVVCRRSKAVSWARNTSLQDFTLETKKLVAMNVSVS